jgi:hypothetical protein
MVQGSTSHSAPCDELLGQLKMEEDEANRIADYLKGEELIEGRTFTTVGLTHKGRKEAERLQSLPYEDVEGRVLWMINKLCGGSLTRLVSIDEIARQLVMEPCDTYPIITDLDERKGLIQAFNEAVLLLPAGKESLQKMMNPQASSKSNSGTIITHVHGDNYGQIHSGHGGTQTLINNESVSEVLPKLSAFIESIREANFERRDRVIEDLEEIKTLVQGNLTPTIWELIQAKFLSVEASMKVAGYVYGSHPNWPAVSYIFQQLYK